MLSSKKDGQLKLVDNTGDINCIVLPQYSGVRPTEVNQLSHTNIKFKEVDQLWIVRKYRFIIERVKLPNTYSIENEFRYVKYIQFATSDMCRFVSRPYSIDRLISSFKSSRKASLFLPIQATKIMVQKDSQASELSSIKVKLVSYKKRLLYIKHKHACNSFDLNQMNKFVIDVQLFYGRNIAIIDDNLKKTLVTVDKCNLNDLKEITDVVQMGKIKATNCGQQYSVDIGLSSSSNAIVIFDDKESLCWYPFLVPGMFFYLCEVTSKSDGSVTSNNYVNPSSRKRKLDSKSNQIFLQNLDDSAGFKDATSRQYFKDKDCTINSSIVNFNSSTMWLEHCDHSLESIPEYYTKNDADYIRDFYNINSKCKNFTNIKDMVDYTMPDQNKAEELSVSNFR